MLGSLTATGVLQVTAMHKSVQKEKEGLADRVAVMETEAKSLREQLASAQETAAIAAKVCQRHHRPIIRIGKRGPFHLQYLWVNGCATVAIERQ